MKLSFVIPTVNHFKMLFDECVSSLQEHMGSGHEIIVVDDGSTVAKDGTEGPLREKIAERCEELGVRFFYNDQNSGFSKTVNKGIREATGDIITIVNNDVVMTQDVSKKIVESFELDEKIGIVGALLFYPHGTIQHGGVITAQGSNRIFAHRGWHKAIPNAPEVLKKTYILGVTGALMSMRREMLDEIGLFNEEYFLASEDVEICLRAWSRGWKVYYNPEIQAIHKEGATRGSNDTDKKRDHRDWYIREQETQKVFARDLKKLCVPDIRSRVLEAVIRSEGKSSCDQVLIQAPEYVSDASVTDESTGDFIVQRSGAFGDVLMATGVIRQLKKAYPNKRIIVATHSQDAVKENPNVDLVLRPGASTPSAWSLDLDLVYEKDPKREVWKTYAKAAGLSEDLDLKPEMVSTEKDLQMLSAKLPPEFLSEGRRIAVVHMGVTWPSRTWSMESWLTTVRLLSQAGYSVVTVGRRPDYKVLADYPNVVNMVGYLSVAEIRELCRKATVFVGVDSGILHVAQTTDVPIVGIFTVCDPQFRVYPRAQKSIALVPKSECRFCLQAQQPPVTTLSCKFGTNACLTEITPLDVVAAVEEAVQ